ncbi:HD-like signal output (HDOD) domain, no enzymatic activity [Quadrisphaera granulorum]|uniref:HD-like signal output (HDOD) protein n=1 Tax=Quadrisphaera granulorum TaxID=317664 RepID=A0A315ZQY6_9ACTN|nr:HDOD domain-containing protein [Quadrisphaera granulorum]PWJ47991.1 HD-like signal output (HDOD) protein [Quadrisphaera granulorum]SZE98563.1 HD-like signal output (HDOD) domain, no enzymatic activity [Quadrisphaera granulorum]
MSPSELHAGLPAPSREELFAAVGHLGARRPVAARVVALAADPSVGARELAHVLGADVALAARVVALANSAAYGLSGRVRTVAFAVTTVGADTVRAFAAAAAAGLEGGEGVPEAFWSRCRLTATASGELSGTFGLPGGEAFCLGLLSALGQAVLWQTDAASYAALLDDDDVRRGGRAALARAELARYGVRHSELSAEAVDSFGFPPELGEALRQLDAEDAVDVVDPIDAVHDAAHPSDTQPLTPWLACLRTAVEVADRLAALPDEQDPRQDLAVLSGGAVTEDDAEALRVRVTAALAESTW